MIHGLAVYFTLSNSLNDFVECFVDDLFDSVYVVR